MRFAFARFFLSCVNSFVHQIFEFLHDRLFDMNWFNVSIITFFNNFVFSFRLFEIELINNRVIRFLILEWLFLKYWVNLFQFAFWVLNFFVIELFTVLISSILTENSIISWFESIFASLFIDQFVIFDARSAVANVKSMLSLNCLEWMCVHLICWSIHNWIYLINRLTQLLVLMMQFENFIIDDER
jgi:hypothetical protein